MIDINELTLGQIQQLRTLLGGAAAPNAHPYEIGKNYFVRTVTYHFVGTLVAVFEQELQFENCSWVADDGRFTQAMATGELNEVEPYPKNARPIIGRGSLIDCNVISWTPPSSQK
jgi:hypothetical protein